MQQRTHLTHICIYALFAAMLCAVAPLSVPIGPIPITLSVLVIGLTAATLGSVRSTVPVFVYLLLGACGLPVFSGWQGGFSRLIGPTGGYLWSYIPMVLVTGILYDLVLNRCKNPIAKWIFSFLAGLPGLLLCYACGTFQYCLITQTAPVAALSACVFPFIPFDLGKMAVVAVLAPRLRRIPQIRLLQTN